MCQIAKGDVHMEAAHGESGVMTERTAVGECSNLQRTKRFTKKMECNTKENNTAVFGEARNA